MTMDENLRDRDKGEEARYKLSEEQQFKIRARRNKLLGLWAAEKLGLSPDARELYAKDLVVTAMVAAGDDVVVAKILNDLSAVGRDVAEETIRQTLSAAHADATHQITGAYPDALDGDHERVGG